MKKQADTFKVMVLFEDPLNREAFEQHLESSHVPLVRKIPRLQSLVTNRIAGSLTGQSPFYLMLELHFPSEEAMQEGLNSEAGQAMGADYSRFASSGVSVHFARAEPEAAEA